MTKANANGGKGERTGAQRVDPDASRSDLSWSQLRDSRPNDNPRRKTLRPRIYAAVAIPVAIPLILAALNADPYAKPVSAASAASVVPTVQLRYADLAEPVSTELPEHSIVLTFEKNDTLGTVFLDGGLQRADAAQLTKAFGEHIDVRRIRPGHQVRFHHDATGAVDSVQMRIQGWGELTAVRGTGGFQVTAREAVQTREEVAISANIRSSLYEAVRETGEGPALVQQLIDVFQWDIDFFALRRGDSFSVVVEKRFADGEFLGYGPILAGRFTHGGETYEAYRHEDSTGHGGYYTSNGAPLRKQFLRSPLKFTRITSGFSKRRFHPVLNIFRPHYGVDYGAPVGTPVMSTADGVILETSYRGGEGKFVRIRHSSSTETWYLHLSRFAKGMKKGTKVQQGDVVGYVGATGLASGPHLDYRVRQDGTWLDPLKLKSIQADPLRGDSLRTFRKELARMQPLLAKPDTDVASAGSKRRALF